MKDQGPMAKKILILEDSNSQARQLSNLLSSQGYMVTRAIDGLDGLYMLAESKPDLVISDVWMPRLNGSGYPLGLSGRETIIEGKILAVADVVESMSSHRPYRPAFGIEIALREVADHKGVLYDPEVVEAARAVLGPIGD